MEPKVGIEPAAYALSRCGAKRGPICIRERLRWLHGPRLWGCCTSLAVRLKSGVQAEPDPGVGLPPAPRPTLRSTVQARLSLRPLLSPRPTHSVQCAPLQISITLASNRSGSRRMAPSSRSPRRQ